MDRRAEDQLAEVVVDEAVVGDPAGLPALYGTSFSKEPELVRQGRDAHTEHEGDVTDAQVLFADREQVDDACAGWVGEGGEQVADGPRAIAAERASEEWRDRGRVEALHRAGISVDLGGKHLSHGSSMPCAVAARPGEGWPAQVTRRRRVDGTEETRHLRDRLWDGLRARLGGGVVLNGHLTERLRNTLSVSFVGRIGADVLAGLHGVAAPTGSACHAGSLELSPVLLAMGIPPEVGMGAVRLSLGRLTTEAEIGRLLDLIGYSRVQASVAR